MKLRSMLFYEAIRTFLGPVLSLHYRISSEGTENVPEGGGAIIVANHRCYVDPFVLSYSIDRYINFAAGSHLYTVPGTRQIFDLAGFFSMDIYGGEEGEKSMDQASRLLDRGELVGIFPEGVESFMSINQVNRIASFKTGFAKIALKTKVPIVPVAIVGLVEKDFPTVPGIFITPFIQHPRAKEGIKLITYRGVTCRVGLPIDLSPYYKETLTKNLIDHIAGKIRRIVIKLYNGEDLDKFMTGEAPFDFVNEKV